MAATRKRRYPKKHADFLRSVRSNYDEWFAMQGGHCAICPREPSTKRRLDIDHDHKLMVVRGLLCNRCNRALGLLERYGYLTPEWLSNTKEYIERQPLM